MKAGVAISPDTPSTAITDEIADAADMLLVMTVYPGKTISDLIAWVSPYEFLRTRWAKVYRPMRPQGSRATRSIPT